MAESCTGAEGSSSPPLEAVTVGLLGVASVVGRCLGGGMGLLSIGVDIAKKSEKLSSNPAEAVPLSPSPSLSAVAGGCSAEYGPALLEPMGVAVDRPLPLLPERPFTSPSTGLRLASVLLASALAWEDCGCGCGEAASVGRVLSGFEALSKAEEEYMEKEKEENCESRWLGGPASTAGWVPLEIFAAGKVMAPPTSVWLSVLPLPFIQRFPS